MPNILSAWTNGTQKKCDQWEEMFSQLLDYYLHHGHCNIPAQYSTNPKLGRWVTVQRHIHNQKKRTNDKSPAMSSNRIKMLESIGFVWSSPKRSTWSEMFSKLESYKSKHGDCLVPQNFPEDPKLGRWVDKQRHCYKCRNEKRPTPLTMKQIEKMESIGFVWSVNKQHNWAEMFQQLEEYRKIHGDCLVQANFKENPKLGRWVSQQRHHYKRWKSGKSSPMDTDMTRIDQLEQIGFAWTFPGKKK